MDKVKVKGYCTKCKSKQKIFAPMLSKTKNGRYIVRGSDQYGHKVNTFVSKDFAAQHGEGLLGNLLGRPGGELFPGSSNIPLLGMLF